MLYIFGKDETISIVYDETTLSEEDKLKGVPVEKLPPKEEKEGFNSILCLDEDKKLYWKLVPAPKDTLEDLVIKEILTKEQYKILTGKDFTF